MKGLGLGLGLIKGASAAAFSPTSLFTGTTGLWYDASDASTLFQDTAGTTPALVASGHPVGRVNDKSPHGKNATQGTAGARPVLATNGAGKTVIRFDGSDDTLSPAISLASVVHTVALVGQLRSFGSAQKCLVHTSQAGVSNFADDRLGVFFGVSVKSASQSATVRAVYMVRIRAANDVDIITNGTTENLTSGFGSDATTAAIGSVANVLFADLDLEEILIFDRALTNGEVTSLNTYLAAKHGL